MSKACIQTLYKHVNKCEDLSEKLKWLVSFEEMEESHHYTMAELGVPFHFNFRQQLIEIDTTMRVESILCYMTDSVNGVKLFSKLLLEKYPTLIAKKITAIRHRTAAQPTESISHKRSTYSSDKEKRPAKASKRVRFLDSDQVYEIPARPTPEAENPTSPAQADQL
jgi:hypothetical protein